MSRKNRRCKRVENPQQITDKIRNKQMLERILYSTDIKENKVSDVRELDNCDFKSKVRVGGPKGKTGSSDFTKGKCAFVRPCTVGWKSQNQPLMKGGGNRTPL